MPLPAARVLEQEVWRWLAEIPDPEIPAISIVDLGIVREVRWIEDQRGERLVVTITPTYSGCPATEVIAGSIRDALAEQGVSEVVLETRLSPPWTTDWLKPEAKAKLRGYGIAPPVGLASNEQAIDASRIFRRREPLPIVACPQCGSTDTEVISQYGSTPCKAQYRCTCCREPFDYFKCH